MNNQDKIYFQVFKNVLKKNSIDIETSLNENTIFNSINSIDNSNQDDLTFFHNSKYLNKLKFTKAKACLIEKKYISYLNQKCIPIIVEDPYLAYALITNLLSPLQLSNGQIHKSSKIFSETTIGKNTQINANVIIKNQCVI